MLTELQIHDEIIKIENEIDELLIEYKIADPSDYAAYDISLNKSRNMKTGLLIALGKVK